MLFCWPSPASPSLTEAVREVLEKCTQKMAVGWAHLLRSGAHVLLSENPGFILPLKGSWGVGGRNNPWRQ